MRRILAVFICVVAATGLAAQITPTAGLSIDTVIHEPSTSEVGPHISGIEVPHPNAGIPGYPDFTNVYGNGNGLHHLPDVTDHFYALGGTTTHDLAYLTNNTGSQITVVMTSLTIAERRANVGPDATSEANFPDPTAQPNLYPYNTGGITIPNGAEAPLFLMATRWRQRLDTSPREYFIVFSFQDQDSNTTMFVESLLRVPSVDDRDGGCTVRRNNMPTGLLFIGFGAMAAYVTRRRIFGHEITGA